MISQQNKQKSKKVNSFRAYLTTDLKVSQPPLEELIHLIRRFLGDPSTPIIGNRLRRRP